MSSQLLLLLLSLLFLTLHLTVLQPFHFFILLIDSLTMPLSIEQGMLAIVAAWDKLSLSHANSVFKSCSL